jgi:hypothetical protein
MAEKVQRKTPKSPRKRQWQRPRIKSGRLFESNSLACGKNFVIDQEGCGQLGTPHTS